MRRKYVLPYFTSAAMAEHLEYDPADEDLTVELQHLDGRCHIQIRLNESLLKMFSPWWRTRLSSNNFQDCGHGGQDRIVRVALAEPDMGALALRAARLALSLDDLTALGQVQTTWQLRQLADMWQFGYLVDLCHRALRVQLRGRPASELEQLLRPALDYSGFLDEVLKPFFRESKEERCKELYLGLGGAATLQLAEAAPIPLFQLENSFQDQLQQASQQWSTQQICDYLKRNVEARSKTFYATLAPDVCIRLFASAPLPCVTDMLQIVQNSRWHRKQRMRAYQAIDLKRLLDSDLSHVRVHHRQLPQTTSMYHALWQASMRFAAHSHVSHSLAPPWTFHFRSTKCETFVDLTVNSGPVKLTFQTESGWNLRASFQTLENAYGVLLLRNDPSSATLCQRGMSFSFQPGQILLVILHDAS